MRLCFDLDGTICHTKREDQNYEDVEPIEGMPDLIRKLYFLGEHYIIIYTARNMATYEGNIGKITAFQVPIIVEWLEKHGIPYDEIVVGKPLADMYVDDRGYKFTTTDKLKEEMELI